MYMDKPKSDGRPAMASNLLAMGLNLRAMELYRLEVCFEEKLETCSDDFF